MILSHELKCIFIKTRKTAGTSLEIALSRYCGPSDIITPVAREDEQTRRALGHRGPQNHLIPFYRYGLEDWRRLFSRRKQKRLMFTNHSQHDFIRKYIDPKVWDAYFKFCFERNPWDKVVSGYFWRTRKQNPPPTLAEYVASDQPYTLCDFDLYASRGDLVVDRVYRLEDMPQALAEIAGRLNLPAPLELPRAKGNYRKDKRHYRELLGESERARIARVFAREIAYFGYEF